MTDTETMRANHYGREMADGRWEKTFPPDRKKAATPSTHGLWFAGNNALDDCSNSSRTQQRKAVAAVRRAFLERWAELQVGAP